MTQHAFRQTNTDRIDANQWQKAPNYGMISIAILEPFLKRVPRYERKKKRQPWSCVAKCRGTRGIPNSLNVALKK